jgi:hypothetical protein
MSEETRRFEEDNKNLVESIKQKRSSYYKYNDIEAPNKDRAISLLNKLQSHDVTDLKRIKKPLKSYDLLIAPLLSLFGLNVRQVHNLLANQIYQCRRK